MIKISIITVVLNDAPHIGETLDSVISQQYPDLEYIVIDGASTDGTMQEIEKRRPFLAKVVSEPDKGIYDAMNKGIRLASGDVIGIINSGDGYLPGALRQVAAAFCHPGSENCILWGDVHYEKLGRVRGFRPKHRYIGAFAPHPSMFVPRGIYEKYGLYDDSMRFLGDYDFMYRTVNVKGVKVLYLPEELAFYREGGLSDCHVLGCLRDELQVKIRYSPAFTPLHLLLFLLKLLKNLPRILKR